ncbi:MAG TPA: preprotein translocase subunit YajC [Actinomycetota bacterium]|nr:preprotein translocase subunit YajC [Actinomycetota bacterium]
MVQLLAASSSSTNANGSLLSLLIPLVLMGGVFYFLLIRPQRNRARQQQSLLSALQVGDEVMTAGGIFGTVTEIDEESDTVMVEIAPGTDVRMLRRAIAQRFTEESDDAGDEESGEEADSRP